MTDKDSIKCTAKVVEDFKDENVLMDLLKWSALFRISKNL